MWKPATISEVEEIVAEDLQQCSDDERALFERVRVPFYRAPIIRYGREETVVVVARKGNDVLYWEDVEEGFNLSPVDENGLILEHWCNQDELPIALRTWRSS